MSATGARRSGGSGDGNATAVLRLVPFVALLAVLVLLVGVRALVRSAPVPPSLAPGTVTLDGEVVAPVDADAIAALRSACRRGSGTHAEAVARVRTEHVAGDLIDSRSVRACPVGFDGLEVRLIGEVVGDVLARDGGAWLTLNDDAHALGAGPLVGHGVRAGTNHGLAVWAPTGTYEQLAAPGRAARRGDIVVVVGTLRRADPEDGGGLSVRATGIEVLVPGASATAPFHRTQALVALVALAGVGLAGAVRLSAGRGAPRPATTGTAARPGSRRSRVAGRRRPDVRGG